MKVISKIIEILMENEENLSDGYGYYSESVDKTLRKIAKKILDAIDAEESLFEEKE